jgi:hypothetical protein
MEEVWGSNPHSSTPAHWPVPIKELAVFDLGAAARCSGKVQQRDSFTKPPAELPECIAGGGRGNLGMDLHRHFAPDIRIWFPVAVT